MLDRVSSAQSNQHNVVLMFIGLSDMNEDDLEAAETLAAECAADSNASRNGYKLLKANNYSREFYITSDTNVCLAELRAAFNRKSTRQRALRPYHAVADQVNVA